jgi:hypothetical protein
MLVRWTTLPVYNIQTGGDAKHALIVTHAVILDTSDTCRLKPMAEVAKRAPEVDSFKLNPSNVATKHLTSTLRRHLHDELLS